MKELLTLTLTIFLAQNAYAQVPTLAQTFDTNVSVINASSSMTNKIRTAEELIKRVVATEEFRSRVLGFTYNGKKQYLNNGGYTNAEIYQKILDGAETLNKNKNNRMDISLEMYYSNNSTVGYTYSNSSKIYANTKFYNNYSSATITGNMFHEWLHKLGFTHTSYYTSSRDSSVPYAIGYIMRDIAAKIKLDQSPSDYFTAAKNLSLTTSGSSLTLTWSAATSSNGIESYKVYRRLSGSSTNYLQGTTSSLKFTQTIPTKDATYYVRAVDRTGSTIKSAEISYSGLTAATNLKVVNSGTKVKLSWSSAKSASGIKEYKIYRRLSGSSTSYLQVTTKNLSYLLSKPTKSAYYYVKAIDNNGSSKNSATVYYQR